jgi:hypothetical protein
VDGAGIGIVAIYLVLFLAALAGIMWLVNRRKVVGQAPAI